MRIGLIDDKHVIECISPDKYGDPTYHIRNKLCMRYYPEVTTRNVLAKLKSMDSAGLVERVKSRFFRNNISWKVKA